MNHRKTLWTTYTPYFKPQAGQSVRVVHNSQKVLSLDMITWIEEHKDEIFRVRAISGDSVALYKVNFSVSIDLLETPICMEE